MKYKFSEVTPEIRRLAENSIEGYKIEPSLYTQYDVKRGLRDVNGSGVVAGLTNISTIKVLNTGDGMPNHGKGKLYYRGIDVEEIVAGFVREKRFGFEETIYLLLFGNMPSGEELDEFKKILSDFRSLPPTFTRDVIMKAPSSNMMNTLAKSVLALYSYDDSANDISIPNVLRQCIELITLLPVLAVYGYQAYKYTSFGGSFFIHDPNPELSVAENLLYMLRPNKNYTLRSLKQEFLIWHWCFMQNTAAEITPPLLFMLYHRQERIPILPLRRLSALSKVLSMAALISRWL